MARNQKRRRYVPKRVDLDPVGTAIARAALLQPQQRAALIEPMRSALDMLRRGAGSWLAWCSMADCMNVAERLVDLNIASDRRGEIEAGQAALSAICKRQADRGTWTLYGTEISALDLAAEIHEIQLEHCSQGELAEAIATVKRCVAAALAGNASPRAILCTPGQLGRPTEVAQ